MNRNPGTPGLPSPRTPTPKPRKPAPKPPMEGIDFDRSPFLVIWETTQACDLACLHCRAEARSCRDRGELSTDEARKLFRDVRRFGRVLLVLTGGDPAKRPDTVELVRYGAGLGLRMGMTPSATPLLTPDFLGSVAEAGLARLAMSLDGASPEAHDRFRGVEGSFDWTWRALSCARTLSVPGTRLGRGSARARGVNDGNGFVFVSHRGEVFPSGFLPVSGGNVRTGDLVDIYRNSPLLTRLRDPNLLRGKCGVCEYRTVCGGSRARAYAESGDVLGAEPICAYQPPRWRDRASARASLTLPTIPGRPV